MHEHRTRWLRLTEVCMVLGRSRSSVLMLIADGRLKAVQHVPHGMWQVEESDLDEYVAALKSRSLIAQSA